eukprot:1299066-Alexandrium_andersonii.AAC.1
MSASLVGSEMCIRDRRPFGPMVVAIASCAWVVVATAIEWRRPAPGLRSVSYTHLTLPTICSV